MYVVSLIGGSPSPPLIPVTQREAFRLLCNRAVVTAERREIMASHAYGVSDLDRPTGPCALMRFYGLHSQALALVCRRGPCSRDADVATLITRNIFEYLYRGMRKRPLALTVPSDRHELQRLRALVHANGERIPSPTWARGVCVYRCRPEPYDFDTTPGLYGFVDGDPLFAVQSHFAGAGSPYPYLSQ